MPGILAIANQKGGVGKTTTATCLAHGLALTGRRVLVVDVDPQGNATSGMGVEMVPKSPAFAPDGLGAAIIQTPWSGVFAVQAGRDLERLGVRGLPSVLILREHLRTLPPDGFHAIIIDCPPSLGPLTQNALAAADRVVVPIQCEYYPLEGLVQLLGAVRQATATNPGLAVAGILLTMYNGSLELSREVEAEVREKLPEPVFDAVIPRDVAVAEAPSHCRSVIDYAPRSPGARGYVELAGEIVKRGIVK